MTRDIAARYSTCVDDFVSTLVTTFDTNLRAIILHGGLVRDPAPIEQWSDIDLILIFRHYSARVTPSISEIVEHLEEHYDVRLDINLLYEADFSTDQVKPRFYQSEIINVLNQRGTRVLYGSLNAGNLALFNEDEAVYVYLNTVLGLFRRYYIENIYKPAQTVRNPIYFQRIARWVFSIIRSSLRLRGIYADPYHASLSQLIRLNLISAQDIELLKRLMGLRDNLRALDSMTPGEVRELYASVESFVEEYVHSVASGS